MPSSVYIFAVSFTDIIFKNLQSQSSEKRREERSMDMAADIDFVRFKGLQERARNDVLPKLDHEDVGTEPENDGKVKDDDDDVWNVEEETRREGVGFGARKSMKKRRISHGFHLVEGKMDHGMEDYLVAENRRMNGHDLGLYAIFDGHSGHKVAEYLRTHLFDNILKEHEFWENPVSAIKQAYKVTDDYILENVVGARGGSTALTAILVDQRQLVVANVGDSRAILSRNGKAKQITVDHDPLKRKEKKMVERKGGFVAKKPNTRNVPRVDGQLAMTRAFGDAQLKEHITVEPDVVIERIGKETQFIVLASDGLWKVMSNKGVVDCVREFNNGEDGARGLIDTALSRGSKDDISCVVVKLE
ncbi:unnamed protein product [Cuscuta campestris]|uniref:protein-serine/threonine phosphatase n=1 Tax=Cuscuta campestris TaxID=132261 RepID=A0A484N404_9ASTE|nr:unnamed protein product [Cuscuta campestris]